MSLRDILGRGNKTPDFDEVLKAAIDARQKWTGEPDWNDPAQHKQFRGIENREAAYVALKMLNNLGIDGGILLKTETKLARIACGQDIDGLLTLRFADEATPAQFTTAQREVDEAINKLVPPVRQK